MTLRKVFVRRTASFLSFARVSAAVALASGVAGCSGVAEDEATAQTTASYAESAFPRKGSTIDSPSVDPGKTYWGARRIGLLEAVLRSPSAVVAAAQRADGILANSPSDGWVTVYELARLEKKTNLFPEERAAIAELWKLLEMAPAKKIAAPPVVTRRRVVVSYSVAPIQYVTDDPLARRIQLEHDSDGDPTTIAGRDLQEAYAQRGSYTAAEVEEMAWLARDIAGGGLAPDAQRIELVGAAASLVFEDAYVRVVVGHDIESTPVASPSPTELPEMTIVGRLHLSRTPASQRVGDVTVRLDSSSGAETSDEKKSARVEIWSGGARVAEYDLAQDAPDASHVERIPFGYAVSFEKFGGRGLPIVPSFGAERRYDDGSLLSISYGAASLPPLAPAVPSGAYAVDGRPRERLDVFSSGRAIYRVGSKAYDCYPSATTRDAKSNRYVGGCRVVDPSAPAEFTYAPKRAPGDSPALVRGIVGGAAVELYPF